MSTIKQTKQQFFSRPCETHHFPKRPLPDPQTLHPVDGTRNEINVLNEDHADTDLSMYNMEDFTFDDKTIWPTDPKKLPKGFEFKDKMMELGKNPGLNIHKLHQKGLDGTGMSIAIIDQLLGDHQEYHDNLVHYEEIGNFVGDKTASMHGSAVSSIAVGKTIGVAPKAKLYYFAAQNIILDNKGQIQRDENGRFRCTAENYIKALERILEINETLPDKEKIQVVSISWGGQSNPEIVGQTEANKWMKALEKAKKTGLFVLTTASDQEYNLDFNGMGRDPLSDPEKTDSWNLQPYWWTQEGTKRAFEGPNASGFKRISVPMDYRTTASPTGSNDYVQYNHGAMSWATPWLAGMFVLARQVDATITPEHFWEIALKTGVPSKEVGGTIIQPLDLIRTLEKERTLTNKKANDKTDKTPTKNPKKKGISLREKLAKKQHTIPPKTKGQKR